MAYMKTWEDWGKKEMTLLRQEGGKKGCGRFTT